MGRRKIGSSAPACGSTRADTGRAPAHGRRGQAGQIKRRAGWAALGKAARGCAGGDRKIAPHPTRTIDGFGVATAAGRQGGAPRWVCATQQISAARRRGVPESRPGPIWPAAGTSNTLTDRHRGEGRRALLGGPIRQPKAGPAAGRHRSARSFPGRRSQQSAPSTAKGPGGEARRGGVGGWVWAVNLFRRRAPPGPPPHRPRNRLPDPSRRGDKRRRLAEVVPGPGATPPQRRAAGPKGAPGALAPTRGGIDPPDAGRSIGGRTGVALTIGERSRTRCGMVVGGGEFGPRG